MLLSLSITRPCPLKLSADARAVRNPSDPAFFVDEVVDGLNLRAFERRYSALGERAYPPRMLLKLWLFAATSGVYSGREIARRLHDDLRFRYLAGELRPDFRTISRFRMVHVEDFREVFRETVRTAREAAGFVGVTIIEVLAKKGGAAPA